MMTPKKNIAIFIALVVGVSVVVCFAVFAHALVRSTFTSTVVSVGASTTATVVANTKRNFLMIQNDHATQVLYCKFGVAAVVNQGIRINGVGGTFIIADAVPTAAVNCIATGAATPALVTEGIQ